jgi:UDP-N-acetylglucosamine acyltransferase
MTAKPGVPPENEIHPTAVVGEGVVLGTGNIVGPYTVILGPCEIGDGNWIGPHAAIGLPAQTRGRAHGSPGASGAGAGVHIGHRNVIREFVTVHQGTDQPTLVGDDCYLMTQAHVPHDATIGDGVTLANSVQIGGHTWVGAGANVGLGTSVHQWATIGAMAMVGMQSAVTRDLPPLAVAVGSPARVTGVNRVALERADWADIDALVEVVGAVLLDGAARDNLPTGIRQLFDEFDAERHVRGRGLR